MFVSLAASFSFNLLISKHDLKWCFEQFFAKECFCNIKNTASTLA